MTMETGCGKSDERPVECPSADQADSRKLLYFRLHLSNPVFWVMVWVLFLGAAIWQHVEGTQQPPIYDAFSYYQKAQNFWASFHGWQLKIVNPLNIEPTIRPPGTVLMSYPFGFNPDFRGFYFRSIFSPILILLLAVYVAIYSKGMSKTAKFDLALLAIFLSTLPTFYHFAMVPNDPSSLYWGLVDNFLLSIAALAVAAWMRSVRTSSYLWLLAAAFLASFSLLIKPAGAYVMVAVSASWAVTTLVQFKSSPRGSETRSHQRKFLLGGIILMGVIEGSVLLACLRSRYLSPENFTFGRMAIAILHAEHTLPLSWLPAIARTSFGYTLPFIMLLTAIAAAKHWRRLDFSSVEPSKHGIQCAIICAISYSGLGIWFWVFWTGGGTQVRYFAPFGAMAIIAVLPVVLVVLPALSKWARLGMRTLFIVQAMNLGLLLLISKPLLMWQQMTGVNLSSGEYQVELLEANRFTEQARSTGKDVWVYSLFSGAGVILIENAFTFQDSLYPSGPFVYLSRPVDWKRPTAVRLNEILESEYVLFTPITPASAVPTEEALKSHVVADFVTEDRIFDWWFSKAGETEGVEKVFLTPDSGLLKIKDRSKLEVSLKILVAQYKWPQSFVDANPQRWWSAEEVAEASTEFPPVIENVSFDGIIILRALWIKVTDQTILIRVWIEQPQANSEDRWLMFFHQVDKGGRIMYGDQIPLPVQRSPDPAKKFSLETDVFQMTPDAKAIAIGFYSGTRLLRADSGKRDWEGKRLILPLTRVP